MSNHGDPLDMAEEVLLGGQEQVLQEQLDEGLVDSMLLGRELEQLGLGKLSVEERRDLVARLDVEIERTGQLLRDAGPTS